MKRTFIIAEAGVNHNGSLEMARKLVKKAKECGVDCVKFQTFKAERVVTQNAPKAQYQMQTTDPKESQLKMLKKMELPEKAYPDLMRVCADEGIMFLSTPYNIEDVDFLNELGVEAFKVASGQIVEPYFLKYIARKGKPMIVSAGMATLAEVDEAVRVIKEAFPLSEKNKYKLPPLTLLHCTTNYPSLLEDANLRAMQTMKSAFGFPIGYSDHTEGIVACIVAVSLGAEIIEKHFTLDKTLPGPDQSCSSDPTEFKQVVTAIRQAEAVLGSSIKKPSAREIENAQVMRRTIVAKTHIPKGTILTMEHLTFKRPLGGVKPSLLEYVIGKKAKEDFQPDEYICFEKLS